MFNFTVKDAIFAALIAVAMNVISFITVPLVTAMPVPGIRNLVVAPFFGLFMAIAMLKIGKPGTATIVSFLVGIMLVFISPLILAFMLASGAIADIAALLWRGSYKSPIAVIAICGIYMMVNVWLGIVFGALFLVENYSLDIFLSQPVAIAIASALCFALGAAGAAVGTKISTEFMRAGVAQ